MFGLSRRLRVFAHAGPTDMRKSFYTLAALVAEGGHDIIAGDAFIFIGRCRRRAKVLWFDGTGLVLLAKRLERGRFAAVWERANGGGLAELTMSELMVFLEGSEIVAKGRIVEQTFSFDGPTAPQ
jgi:transposase